MHWEAFNLTVTFLILTWSVFNLRKTIFGILIHAMVLEVNNKECRTSEDCQGQGDSGYSSDSDKSNGGGGSDEEHHNAVNISLSSQTTIMAHDPIQIVEQPLSNHNNVEVENNKIVKKVNVEKRTVETQTFRDPIVHEAILMARDLLHYGKWCNSQSSKNILSSWRKQPPFLSGHSKTLVDLVDEIINRHEPVYRSMVKSLTQSKKIKLGSLKIICDQLFDGEPDKNMSWGKIVALYALCVELGRRCTEELEEADYFQALYACDFIGTYTGEKTAQWIDKQGGWVRKRSCTLFSVFTRMESGTKIDVGLSNDTSAVAVYRGL